MDDFNLMTDTGKFAAIKEARARAESAEGTLAKIKRYLWGIVLLVFDLDELADNIIRHKEKVTKFAKENKNVIK